MSEPTNLAEDWPADPDHDDLLRFAEQVQAALPVLPPAALARVEARVQAELRHPPRRSWRRFAWGCSAAASLLFVLGVGGYFLTRSQNSDKAPPPNLAGQNEPALIEDRVTIAVGAAGAPAVEKPLLQVDKYKSLFTN